jgi:predicted ATP-grasp superfamily ATP-dependent carboligase
LFDATKQKVRQYPPGMGQSTYNRLSWNADVAALGKRFLQGAGVRGPAYVEFKLDPWDRRYKLIECNHRFVGPNELLRHGGVDLALLTYNRVIGHPDPPLGPIRWGVAVWSPFADTSAFRALRRRGDLTLGRWLRSLVGRVYAEGVTWRDPRPSVMRLARALRGRARPSA